MALLALAGYLLLSINAFLSARVLDELKLSYVAAGPTEVRLALIIFTLAMLITGTGPIVMSSFSPYDLATAIAGMALITLFIVQTIVTARRIAAKEHAGEM